MSIVWDSIPLTAAYFYVDIPSFDKFPVGSVDGLQVENEVANYTQQSTKGMSNQVVGLGRVKYPGELTIKRLAPQSVSDDKMWQWMTKIREAGSIAAERKSGSVVIYDVSGKEMSRWNFHNAWPSKIVQDGLDATKNEFVHETITLQYDKLERKK